MGIIVLAIVVGGDKPSISWSKISHLKVTATLTFKNDCRPGPRSLNFLTFEIIMYHQTMALLGVSSVFVGMTSVTDELSPFNRFKLYIVTILILYRHFKRLNMSTVHSRYLAVEGTL